MKQHGLIIMVGRCMFPQILGVSYIELDGLLNVHQRFIASYILSLTFIEAKLIGAQTPTYTIRIAGWTLASRITRPIHSYFCLSTLDRA